ncbi:unnamed protein product [Rhizophagus irregularis]|nr:unnamed protein product [Rhizophagus irregularis]
MCPEKCFEIVRDIMHKFRTRLSIQKTSGNDHVLEHFLDIHLRPKSKMMIITCVDFEIPIIISNDSTFACSWMSIKKYCPRFSDFFFFHFPEFVWI